jgi:predicted RNase H-like HicB family nuclease
MNITIRFERDEDGWWVASALEIPGCHTQGRSISQARQRILEALGLFIDDVESVVFVEGIKLPATAQRIVEASAAARVEAEKTQQQAQETTRAAVEALTTKLSLSVRDASEVLGLSHQRVQQLVRKRTPTTRKRQTRRANA